VYTLNIVLRRIQKRLQRTEAVEMKFFETCRRLSNNRLEEEWRYEAGTKYTPSLKKNKLMSAKLL
jgi:hypothetical protein